MKRVVLPLLFAVVLVGIVVMLVVREFSAAADKSSAPGYVIEVDESGVSIQFNVVARIPLDIESPSGIAVGPDGALYVCGESGVSIYDPTGRIVSHFPLDRPADCIAVGEDGTAYLGAGDSVVVLDTATGGISPWAPIDERSIITSIAVYMDRVYIADAGVRMMWEYDTGGMLIGYVEHGFIIPSPYFDVAVDAEGNPWIADTGRHTLMKIGKDGEVAESWGRYAMDVSGFSGCCNPAHFAILPDGMFVTAEKGLQRLKLHAADGGFVGLLAQTRSFGGAVEGLDIAVAPDGTVYVLRGASGEVITYRRTGV